MKSVEADDAVDLENRDGEAQQSHLSEQGELKAEVPPLSEEQDRLAVKLVSEIEMARAAKPENCAQVDYTQIPLRLTWDRREKAIGKYVEHHTKADRDEILRKVRKELSGPSPQLRIEEVQPLSEE